MRLPYILLFLGGFLALASFGLDLSFPERLHRWVLWLRVVGLVLIVAAAGAGLAE